MAPLVWLVTGSTAGIGSALVKEAVSRGDKVIASGRNVAEKLSNLKSDNVTLLELDITAPRQDIDTKIKEAWAIFGHIDVVVNNAGFMASKLLEEADDSYISHMFNVNLFAPMRITQAVLPLLRAQGHGVLAYTGASIVYCPAPFTGHYSAAKAALGAWVAVLHSELRNTGINCVCIELGGFATELGHARNHPNQEQMGSRPPEIAAYETLYKQHFGLLMSNRTHVLPGDVDKGAARMVDIVKKEGMAAGKPWTTRVTLGSDATGFARLHSEYMLQSLESWKDVNLSTDKEGTDPQFYKQTDNWARAV